MKDTNTYDILIALIIGCQSKTMFEGCEYDLVRSDIDSLELNMSAHYLLKQSLYQIWLPHNHYRASKGAIDLWNEITLGEDDIFSFGYKSKIEVRCPEIKLNCYKGNSSKPESTVFHNGDYFEFRQVFHDEHIVPLGMIFDELLKLDFTDNDYENCKKVKDVIDKIYICKVLKEEDRKLNKIAKTKRCSFNYDDILKNEYRKAGIEIGCQWK